MKTGADNEAVRESFTFELPMPNGSAWYDVI